jgi:hypothetical protein
MIPNDKIKPILHIDFHGKLKRENEWKGNIDIGWMSLKEYFD